MLKAATLVASLLAAWPAAGITRDHWHLRDTNFKEGYLIAVAEHLMSVLTTNDGIGNRRLERYSSCLAQTRSDLLVRLLDEYFARNPSSFRQPVLISAFSMFYEICSIESVK